MDITDVTLEFTHEKQQNLFSANIWEHIQEQQRRLNGGGRGDVVGCALQQFSAVAPGDKDTDNAPVKGGDNAGLGQGVQGHHNGYGFGRGRAGH